MSIQDAALALLVSQHTTDLAMREELDRLAKENLKLKLAQLAEKAANPPKAKKSKAPIHQAPSVLSVLRTPTVETAHEFLKSMRASKSRDESIKAIDLFIGYNLAGNFGDQDVRARMLAQSTIKPVSTTGPTREELRSASRSVAGFVAGLPDHHTRELGVWKDRVEVAVAKLFECEKSGDEVGAAVERERLAHIYTQMKTLGFDLT